MANWSIVNKRSSKVYASESRDGRLMSDFLLLTYLPNVFDRESYDNGEGVFLLAGAHGVGTRATDLLLRDSSLLSRLTEKVGQSMYWQALFKIEGVYHFHRDQKLETRWHPRALDQSFQIATVPFDEESLQELSFWA